MVESFDAASLMDSVNEEEEPPLRKARPNAENLQVRLRNMPKFDN